MFFSLPQNFEVIQELGNSVAGSTAICFFLEQPNISFLQADHAPAGGGITAISS